jgi:hypothetical protein
MLGDVELSMLKLMVLSASESGAILQGDVPLEQKQL